MTKREERILQLVWSDKEPERTVKEIRAIIDKEYPTTQTTEIPHEISAAAILLDNYFKESNIKYWQLYGVCSREFVYRYESLTEKLKILVTRTLNYDNY